MTTPFVPASVVGANDGNEFVALYLFDKVGKLLDAIIDEFGPRATLNRPSSPKSTSYLMIRMDDRPS